MRLYEKLEKEHNSKSEQISIEKKEQEWLKENKEAIEKHNERIEKYGCFSDDLRRF